MPTQTRHLPIFRSSRRTIAHEEQFFAGIGPHIAVHDPQVGELLPLADYEVSEDGLTWTFKIKKDVKFSDGEALTAKDVAFTYNKTKEVGTNYDFSTLEKAEAVDDETVRMTFTTP